jgi:hypothetical protein
LKINKNIRVSLQTKKKEEIEIKRDMVTMPKGIIQNNDSEYVRLVTHISGLWEKAKEKAASAVNTELLEASWETGRYIVEYEQHGNVKAEYGKVLGARKDELLMEYALQGIDNKTLCCTLSTLST